MPRVLSIAFACAIVATPATAAAAPSLSWSSPQALPSGAAASAVSCPSEAACVGVSHEGYALTSTNRTASTPEWHALQIDTGVGARLNSVSCAPAGPCVAIDNHGNVFYESGPGSSWSQSSLKGAPVLTGVSCPSSSLCVAVDEASELWTSTNPASGSSWEATAKFAGGHKWTAVSCASSSLCVAVDAGGDVVSSTEPTGGVGSWHEQKLAAGALVAVSCASSSLCVAVGEAGEAIASADPSAAQPSWTLTTIDGTALSGVSCATTGLCVAVDTSGRALASGNAAAAVPSWGEPGGIAGHALAGVSCLTDGLCVALDTAGNAFSGRVPAPAVTTLGPAQVTSASAVLVGVVEPNYAVLGACDFELGAGAVGTAYTLLVPCSVAASSIAGRDEVSAAVAGLAPNTTYHYRITASSPQGNGVGEGVAFTTAVSPQIALITPHPSITGTPAVGQRLTCHPNLAAGAEARLTYAWVRDLIPIPDTDASTYTVKGQDSGHHLQCQVTATDGGGSVTEKSAFVTIPRGGPPVSAGETQVGGATFKDGRVSVPIVCSAHASGGCEVVLRLTSSLHHRTIPLAGSRAHLAAGVHTTVSARLGPIGRRLLATNRRLTAHLYVSGTVIGVIRSQLANELVTLRSSAIHDSRHR